MPEAQEHFLTPSARRDTHPFGGLGLKETRDLEESFIAAGGLRERLIRRLTNAHNNLDAAREDLVAYYDDEDVQRLLSRCKQALQRLVEVDE